MRKILILTSFISSVLVLAQENKVGVNTEQPKAVLDIRGDLIVENPDTYTGAGNYSPLYINKNAAVGEKEIHSGTEKKKTMYHFKLKINSKGDWVKDYDTKIPVDDYILFSTAYNLYKSDGRAAVISGQNAWWRDKTNPLAKVSVNRSGGTWHILADYPNAAPIIEGNYYWVLDLVAIDAVDVIYKDITPSGSQGARRKTDFKLNTASTGGFEANPLP